MSNIPGYQHRVMSLRILIASSLTRLRDFIASPLYAGVDPSEQIRLRQQEELMDALVAVLQARIDFFPEVNRRVEEARVASTADIHAALGLPDIPLDTIGEIISTDVHVDWANTVDESDCIKFWGRFTYEGLALQEIARAHLRKHLLHAMGKSQDQAANLRPAGYIGVVALKAGV